jgi:outer membrane protein assembly factor BamB
LSEAGSQAGEVQVQSAPLVAQGVLMFGTAGMLLAADPRTGARRWGMAYDAERLPPFLTTDGERRTLFTLGASGANLHAVDIATGEASWTSRLPGGHRFAPGVRTAFQNGRLFAAIERSHPYRQSALLAVDARTGQRVRSALTTSPAHDLCITLPSLLVLERGGVSGAPSTVLVARDPETLVTQWRLSVEGHGPGASAVRATDTHAWFGGGSRLTCADLERGTEMWRREQMTPRSLDLVSRPGEPPLVLVQTHSALAALDGLSGRTLWSVELEPDTPSASLCCARGVVYHGQSRTLKAYSLETGRHLASAASFGGTGGAVWSDGVRVYWATAERVQIHAAVRPA